jgi:hypothetical protein
MAIIPAARNLIRVKSAKRAILAYNHKASVIREDVTDLLADIMHFCKHKEWSFDKLLESADSHFLSETEKR